MAGHVVTTVESWRVTHDASGKILVRALDHRQREVVIAKAQWSDDKSTDHRQTNAANPSDEQWTAIDAAVRAAIAASAGAPPDPTLDPGDFPANVKPTYRLSDTKLGIQHWIVAVLVLAVLAVGLYFVMPFIKLGSSGGKANGEACTYDSECRSDVCDVARCAAAKRLRGDRCNRDSECKSGDCRRHICD